MSNPKFEITNPQALELIEKFKSGSIFLPVKTKLIQYKWIIISVVVLLALPISIAIGKSLFEKAPSNEFIPPEIENVKPVEKEVIKSDFDGLKTQIRTFNIELPDPIMPPVDNKIDLEPKVIE
jgi:hypothetical protein